MPPPERLLLDRVASPLGEMLLVTDAAGVLRAADFHDHEVRLRRLLRLHYGALAPVAGVAPALVRQGFAAYFDGALAALAALPWATGGTAFQQQVWAALGEIPAGQTLSYGAFALGLGRPAAVRAVGAANGGNPLSIVVPCHRLVGAQGALTGYGGGLARNQWLLRHAGAVLTAG